MSDLQTESRDRHDYRDPAGVDRSLVRFMSIDRFGGPMLRFDEFMGSEAAAGWFVSAAAIMC
jgi:hypothetical protein